MRVKVTQPACPVLSACVLIKPFLDSAVGMGGECFNRPGAADLHYEGSGIGVRAQA